MSNSSPLARLIHTWGFELLRNAKAYSEDTGLNPWEFSIEVPTLVDGGLSITDLRWLIAKGYAEHANETTRWNHKVRRFRTIKALIFPPKACVTLTRVGFDAAESVFEKTPFNPGASNTPSAGMHLGREVLINSSNARGAGAVEAVRLQAASTSLKSRPSTGPQWNADLHELRMGRRMVKRFMRPAPSQELILAVFEEEGWPEGIDDPLLMIPGTDSKRRLHYTVHHLNHGQQPFLIRFYVNGDGQRVYWRSVSDRRTNSARSVRKRQ